MLPSFTCDESNEVNMRDRLPWNPGKRIVTAATRTTPICVLFGGNF